MRNHEFRVFLLTLYNELRYRCDHIMLTHTSSQQGRAVRAELILRGLSLSDIARRCDVTPSAVSRVVARRATSRKIEGEIARMLGRPRRDLFPQLRWVAVVGDGPRQSQRQRHTKDAA